MTISTLTIDPGSLPIDWQTGTTYTILVGSDFVREVGNNRTPSPVRTATITTYAFGPEVTSVSPAFNSQDSFSTAGTLTYNRPFTSAGNNKKYKLYETTGSNTSLVLEIDSTSSRVAITGSNVTLDFTDYIKGNHQYHLEIDAGVVKDRFRFDSQAVINNSVFKYTIGQPPVPVTVSPVFNSTGSFISTASITFNRSVNLVKNNFYLYNNSGVVRTLSSTGTNVYKVSNTSVAVTLYDEAIPEATYYIGYDLNAIKDTNGIPADASTSTVKWTSQSITSVEDDDYNTRIPTKVFENWYDVLDRSSDSNEQYTIRLQATSGTFTSTVGVTVGNTWTYTGSREQIEAVDNLFFNATTPNINWDLPVSTQLIRDGVTIATRSNTLIGLPFDLRQDRFTVSSNSLTNVFTSSTNITATANTASVFNSIDGGLLTYKAQQIKGGPITPLTVEKIPGSNYY
jgi:hypothetical protein